MDQPKPLSAIEKVEKLLGIEWVVTPVNRALLNSTGFRQNHVKVTEPSGKTYGVTRRKSKRAINTSYYKAWCDCPEGKKGDDNCEHTQKARAYWLKLDQGT